MVDRQTDGQTTDGRWLNGYTISSPCEPNGSGELIRPGRPFAHGPSVVFFYLHSRDFPNFQASFAGFW